VVDPTPLSEAVVAALGTVTGISVYDGLVPRDVPATAEGYVLPYAVLWAGDGNESSETTSDGNQPTDTLTWDFQVTVVASNVAACRAVAHSVKLALINLRVGTGIVRKNPDGFDESVPIPVPEVAPARYMKPIQFRLITN
jgi:hypothetical protein